MNRCKQNKVRRMAKCEVPFRSVNMRPRKVRDGCILLCFSDGGGGGRGPGEGEQEKEAGGGGESAQLHPDFGGEGRELSPQPASRPRSTCASCTWLSNEEPRNLRARPLRFPSTPSSSPAPVPPLLCDPVLDWAANARWAGTTEGRRERNTRCRGDRRAELIM